MLLVRDGFSDTLARQEQRGNAEKNVTGQETSRPQRTPHEKPPTLSDTSESPENLTLINGVERESQVFYAGISSQDVPRSKLFPALHAETPCVRGTHPQDRHGQLGWQTLIDAVTYVSPRV